MKKLKTNFLALGAATAKKAENDLRRLCENPEFGKYPTECAELERMLGRDRIAVERGVFMMLADKTNRFAAEQAALADVSAKFSFAFAAAGTAVEKTGAFPDGSGAESLSDIFGAACRCDADVFKKLPCCDSAIRAALKIIEMLKSAPESCRENKPLRTLAKSLLSALTGIKAEKL